MPPKKRVVRRAVAALVDNDAVGPGSGDGNPLKLPSSFHGAVERLVKMVQSAIDDTVTMFKLEMANVPANRSAADTFADISAKAQPDLCAVVPLCEVQPSDLPANGCASLFDQRQYAEALLHAVRAHFAFVEFDRRLIYTSTAGLRDPSAASHLLYIFSYVKTAPATAEPAASAVSAAAKTPKAVNRRRTVATPMRRFQDEDNGVGSIGDELENLGNRLERVERSLLEASQSLSDEDMRLPETAVNTSLGDVPAPALGTALHAVLPRIQTTAATKRATAKQSSARQTSARQSSTEQPSAKPQPPRGIVSHQEAVAASAARAASGRAPRAPRAAPAAATRAPAAAARRGKRHRSGSPTAPAWADAVDMPAAPAPAPEPAEPEVPAGLQSPSRSGTGHLPPAEADQLVAFFQKLNGSQTEQSRVSLTCRYAKMRYGHDVSSGVVYRLVEGAARGGRGAAAAAPTPAPLTEDSKRQTALAVYGELDPSHTEQSRVAYTLQYMRVQHSERMDANTLFGWLGQGSKKPTAKRARLR